LYLTWARNSALYIPIGDRQLERPVISLTMKAAGLGIGVLLIYEGLINKGYSWGILNIVGGFIMGLVIAGPSLFKGKS
jgi:hypothetical protein